MRQVEKTIYVVLPFLQRGRKIVADQPREARSADHAKAMAERLAVTRPAVVAFSRTGDPDLGEFDDAVILARFGELPEEVLNDLAT
jgi:hypothetical protein